MDYQIRHPKNNREIYNVFGMLEVCFPKIDRAYFIKRFLGEPNYNKKNTYLLIKDGSIISHAQLFKKKIYCYGKQLPIMGLGAICTLPEYRNRGYSKALLKKAIQDSASGYIALGPSHFPHGAKIENLFTMMDAIRKFGKNPDN